MFCFKDCLLCWCSSTNSKSSSTKQKTKKKKNEIFIHRVFFERKNFQAALYKSLVFFVDKWRLILFVFHWQQKNKRHLNIETLLKWRWVASLGLVSRQHWTWDKILYGICYYKNKKGHRISIVISDDIRWEMGCNVI